MKIKISGKIIKDLEKFEPINKELILKVSSEKTKIIDEYIKLYVKPRPKWLPNIIYKFLLRKLLFIKETKDV